MSEPANDAGTATELVSNTTDRFDGNPEYIRKNENCDGQPASMIGTERRGLAQRVEFKDIFQLLGDDDSARGRAKNDRMCGKGGDDVLRGGTENDTLFGGGGNDTLNGNGGNDVCFGGGGSDTFKGCEEIEQ